MIYLNGNPVSTTLFPDNTSQVWKLSPKTFKFGHAKVRWEFSHEGEFMHLAQLKDLLDFYRVPASLELPYLPYGRQDKLVGNETTFALRTFMTMLNRLHFDSVQIEDPHSEIALLHITNSSAVYPREKLYDAMTQTDSDLVCYPDKGAREKYSKVYPTFQNMVIYGDKVRDQLSGQITSYKVIGDPAGKSVMIVDDICDGGMTFKMLAQDLLAAGAKEVNLFVSHGIFSRGVRTLHDSGIKRVFTKDGEVSDRFINVQV